LKCLKNLKKTLIRRKHEQNHFIDNLISNKNYFTNDINSHSNNDCDDDESGDDLVRYLFYRNFYWNLFFFILLNTW